MTSHRDVFKSFFLDPPHRAVLFNLLETNLLLDLRNLLLMSDFSSYFIGKLLFISLY